MSQFKVGDKAVPREGYSCAHTEDAGKGGYLLVTRVDGDGISFNIFQSDGTKVGSCYSIGNFDCVDFSRMVVMGEKKDAPQPKFILQYMRKEDPFEFFATERELTARVSELVKDSSVRQDSYRWYEIARQGTVELQPKLKLNLSEPKQKSSGRKRHTFKTCEACGKTFNRLGTHQKAAHPELTK